ncbi:MAG: Gar1/Naf1 family protein [Methanobacteriaceae archaeon]|nr:Gar1/Naf1 family protein [Methanobacteriaceae archaeon]
MKVLGNILHLANSGKLIVKTTKTPPAGAFVFTNDKNKIGRVGRIFGPVKTPYVSINLYRSVNKRDLENRCGEKLFVSTKKEDKEFKKSNRSKSKNNKSKSSKSKSKSSKSKGFRANDVKNKRNKNSKNTKSSNKKKDRKNKKRRG